MKSPLPREGRGHGTEFSNPQPNPQQSVSCATYAYFGSPRVFVSCCKTYYRSAVTAEVASSSLVVPASFFNHLTKLDQKICVQSGSN